MICYTIYSMFGEICCSSLYYRELFEDLNDHVNFTTVYVETMINLTGSLVPSIVIYILSGVINFHDYLTWSQALCSALPQRVLTN